jgi:hypothetical protein
VLPSEEQQTGDHDRGESDEAVRHDQVHAGTKTQMMRRPSLDMCILAGS